MQEPAAGRGRLDRGKRPGSGLSLGRFRSGTEGSAGYDATGRVATERLGDYQGGRDQANEGANELVHTDDSVQHRARIGRDEEPKAGGEHSRIHAGRIAPTASTREYPLVPPGTGTKGMVHQGTGVRVSANAILVSG